MVTLIWTDQAIDDLDSIGEYISENSDKYAQLTVQKLYNKTKILAQFPFSGRTVPEKNIENIRELIEGNYRIIYHIANADVIYILTIYHSARDLKI